MNPTKGTITTKQHHRRIPSSSSGTTSCRRRCNHSLTFLLPTIVTLLGAMAFQGADASVVHTYKQTSSQLGQKVTSSTLMWEQYSAKDLSQMEYAIQGGKYVSEDEHYPIYVCRVSIEGVQTSGHTEKQKQSQLCVVSYLKEVKKYDKFEVLVNKGHLGKIIWKPWRKFNAGVPIGAISVDDYSYIGRRRINHQSINDHMGADFTLGRFDPTLGLGKILVVEDQYEREYDDGEVLIETEPIRYELRDIVLDKIRTDERVNTTEMAHGILENTYDTSNQIETVLSYSFDHVQYWGTHEGIARGLATKVYEKGATIPAEIYWGLKFAKKIKETKSVSSNLPPGTAINVTLLGDYVTLEAPYRAKLFAFYQGISESVSRNITAEVRKSYLKDIKLEYSPVYWIENGTFIPTTTTTTTSTTTHPTTTKHSDAKPMSEPPIVLLSDIGRSVVSTSSADSKSSKSKSDSNGDDINENIIPNESRENYAENLKHMKDAASPGTSHSTRLYCWTNSILILLILVTVRVFG
ncbi:protein unzipped [Episyrphus balteatus]|uniref:protein unzipped n=1 Tax=Episyrphus balteatus TaxID=286459 RepID=UPI0024865E53|nr:protein unzipped [Episyrphus balteatus]XP_055853983.1 protein unzipped [Episyrphus balteatus]